MPPPHNRTGLSPTAKMPALSNPRHEAFAQALFVGLGGKTRKERAASTAYLTAYPNCSPGHSAESAAWRLLRRVEPILVRVRELQAEQATRTQRKIDISRTRLAQRLDEASRLAEQQGNPSAMVSAELGIAKVFGHDHGTKDYNPQDFSQAKSMRDIAIRLLQSVGYASPDDASIAAAIEANDAFIARLEAIRAAADGTIDEDD